MSLVENKIVWQTENLEDITSKIVTSGDRIFLLQGELGAGKTHLVQHLGDILGITQTITSPTFTVMQEYVVLSETVDWKKLYHFDLYRMENITEQSLEDINYFVAIEDQNALVCIEWPQKIPTEFYPHSAIEIAIEVLDQTTRKYNWATI